MLEVPKIGFVENGKKLFSPVDTSPWLQQSKVKMTFSRSPKAFPVLKGGLYGAMHTPRWNLPFCGMNLMLHRDLLFWKRKSSCHNLMYRYFFFFGPLVNSCKNCIMIQEFKVLWKSFLLPILKVNFSTIRTRIWRERRESDQPSFDKSHTCLLLLLHLLLCANELCRAATLPLAALLRLKRPGPQKTYWWSSSSIAEL